MPKNVLITGGCGFIGRRLTEELLAYGYGVRVLDSLVEQVHGEASSARHDHVDYVISDVRDAEAVERALRGIDAVVHLAAEVGVGQSMYEIARYVGANDLGTSVLLEALIDSEVEQVVVASSMSVYGEGLYAARDGSPKPTVRRRWGQLGPDRWDPRDSDGNELTPVATDETKPVDLASIYALTKYFQERAVLIFGEAYGRKATALRLFNVFGPGQALSNPYTGVLANFASRLTNGQAPMIFEDGWQRRDFVHVSDVASAFRLALEEPQADGEVINIGSGQSYAIREVASLLAQAMGLPAIEPDILQTARSGDIRHCFADITKARTMIGFEPAHGLDNSLEELVDWVKGTRAVDRGLEMRRRLEDRGLVA